jgi:peptide/nickel transport system permease protein
VQSRLIARITRSSMLDVLREQFILAGRAKGLAERAIVYKHALKNAMIPTVTIIGISFAILIGGAIVPSWGNILSEGRLYLRQAPWLVLYPGAAIMVTILGLNLVGDGLRDLLDPKIRGLQTERQRAA